MLASACAVIVVLFGGLLFFQRMEGTVTLLNPDAFAAASQCLTLTLPEADTL